MHEIIGKHGGTDFRAWDAGMAGTKVERTSPFSGAAHRMTIPLSWGEFVQAYGRWTQGTMVQNAFPGLDANQREFLMTGIPPGEWPF